jgi:hypothetical protein
MTVIVKHNKTNTITDWTQAYLNEQIALGNYPPGTLLADIVLPSDWNNDHTLTGLGTMAEQNANTVAITGGTINNTTIGATTASTGKFTDLTDTGLTSGRVTYATTGGNLVDSANLTFNGTTLTTTAVTTPSITATTTDLTLSAISTGNLNLNTAGGTGLRVSDVASSVRYVTFNGAGASGSPGFFASAGSLAQSSGATSNINFYTNLFAQEQMRISHTASAVNYVQVTGGATGNRPTISAQGSDNPISLDINAKGSAGTVRIGNALSTAFGIFQGVSGQTVVNYPTFIAGQTTNAIQTQATGTDTNISMAFQPKGTGAIDLAAGSSGVNISNGGTVTAITRTAAGVGYTTAPTWSASAPTTAGGVTATGTTTLLLYSPVINNGGTGYTVGNTLTVVGGTFSPNASTLTVTSVSSGVITGITIATGGTYTATPTYPASVTGGSGSGATFTLSAGINTLAIGNAGSGYIEQPTITFSGGGGSGAAAYATVGSVPIVKTIASALSFTTPSSEVFRIVDANSTGQNYISLESSGGGSNFRNAGAGTNLSTYFISKGTGTISFATNASTSTEQLRVSHTASAVNYVQVTGGATGTTVQVTAQGSDAAVGLQLVSKTASIVFVTRSGNARSFNILDSALPVNYLQVQGNTAGVAPILSAQGTDTDIDLALTPKGTGLVRFGTYTGTILTPTGYIEIKDSGGTIRRLLVG